VADRNLKGSGQHYKITATCKPSFTGPLTIVISVMQNTRLNRYFAYADSTRIAAESVYEIGTEIASRSAITSEGI